MEQVQAVQQRGWWSRNWKWFVPAGCLSMILLAVVLILLIVAAVFSAIKSAQPYKDALAAAKANQAVTAVLGSPVKEGFTVSGNINVNGPAGEANMSIPISGPNGKAKIYVVGTKSANQWTYSTLMVQVEGSGQQVDLLK